MAINFPASPVVDETFTSGNTTWKWDGTAWNVVSNETGRNIFLTFAADTGSAVPDTLNDTLNIEGGSNVTTTISGKTLTINSSGGGLTQNVFDTITADEGSTTAASVNDTLNILGGTNISTSIATDTDNVTINLDSFSIDFLSDVDTTSSAPTTGQVLKWDGAKWAPAADATTGGAGTDADTLDGFDGSYYLDYNNLNNKPAILTLSSLSVGVENTPSGNGAINYDNATGVFKFTPPDLSVYATTASLATVATSGAYTDLTSTPTTIAGYGITDAYTANQSLDTTSSPEFRNTTIRDTGGGNPGLTIADNITQSASTSLSIERLNNALGDLISASVSGQGTKFRVAASGQIVAGGITYPITDGTAGQVLTTDGAGNLSFTTVTGGGGGEANQNAFSIVAVSGQSNVEADTTTDTLTLSAGSGISITTNAGTDTVTITSTVTPGATTLNGLSDISSAGIDVHDIYEHAIVTLRLGNVGISAYTIDSHYSGNNPTIYVLSGTTVAFDLDNIGGHPFELQDNTLTALSSNLVHVANDGTVSTNSSAQGKDSGMLYWRIPENITNNTNYVYQCQSHAAMFGTMTIKRLSNI